MIVFVSQYNAPLITSIVKRDGVTVWSSIDDVPKSENNGFGFNALERVHAMILDISQPDPNVQYLLAQAIVQHKPTLCIYSKANVPRDIINYLSQKNIPASIKHKSYTSSSLEHVLEQFLQSTNTTLSSNETPSIKFTLRLTPTLDRYMKWLVDHRQANKAEYMRRLLTKAMKEDEEYQEWS